MLTKRLEILVDEKEYERLREQARASKTSVGELMRRAARELYLAPEHKKRQAAARRLLSVSVDWGDWEELKAELARERVRQVAKP